MRESIFISMGRPETNHARMSAMTQLGNGLSEAELDEEALTVGEAELSMRRRMGASEERMLVVQANLAVSYEKLGQSEKALPMQRDVYRGRLKLHGEEDEKTLRAATNYASSLRDQRLFEEAKSLLLKTIPVARRVLGEGHRITLKIRWTYAEALYKDDGATLDDLREAVTTLEDTARIARRVFGGAHPITVGIAQHLRAARAALAARETPSPSA